MFDDIIQAAKQNNQTDSVEQKVVEPVDEFDSSNVRINVIGVGGAGCAGGACVVGAGGGAGFVGATGHKKRKNSCNKYRWQTSKICKCP